jgi:hypothetical protein
MFENICLGTYHAIWHCITAGEVCLSAGSASPFATFD